VTVIFPGELEKLSLQLEHFFKTSSHNRPFTQRQCKAPFGAFWKNVVGYMFLESVSLSKKAGH
jgi:hypothetical protein